MKLSRRGKRIITISLVTILILTSIIFFIIKKDKNNSINLEENKINIEEIISNIKLKSGKLKYESKTIKEFISLVFEENNRYKNFIIDTQTGKQLSFFDIIKEDKIIDFDNKEKELLSLKYPNFIVKGIEQNNGYKIYYVKDNEVIIFYYDYEFDYEYKENISLKIDYNEIKDYLNFSYQLNETYENENGFNYKKDKKAVAITFDDGQSIKYNQLILDELENNKAHATFFVVGYMMNNCRKCILNTYNSGNEIGTHTYEHINLKDSSILEVDESIKKSNNTYKKITNDDFDLIRPPYGAYDTENLENINMPLILWNIDTEDWRYKDVDRIVNHVMENVKDGSIILMHELYETSYQALKILLPKLYIEGYQVVSISELAELKEQKLLNGKVYTSIK